MKRREFILLLASTAVVRPPIARAQVPAKIPRVGILMTGTPSTTEHYVNAFNRGLRELGYVEGQSIAVEYRWVEERAERFSAAAVELVRAKLDLILVWGTPAATAVKQATSVIPTVFVAVGDPVGNKIVASLARPGGNITGFTNIAADLMGKLLELLKEVVPGLTRVAALRNPDSPVSVSFVRWAQAAAQTLGVQLQVVEVKGAADLEDGFSSMVEKRAGAIMVLPDPMFIHQRTRIADLATKNQLPTIFNVRQYVEAGGLMAYGPSLVDLFRRAPSYVDKILKGAKPGELPVEQPTKFELSLNLKTASALGLAIPTSLLARADEVIE